MRQKKAKQLRREAVKQLEHFKTNHPEEYLKMSRPVKFYNAYGVHIYVVYPNFIHRMRRGFILRQQAANRAGGAR